MPLLAVDRAVESNAAQPASANFTTGSIGRDLLIVKADRQEPLVVVRLSLAAKIAKVAV
jgi:hypothetical protein